MNATEAASVFEPLCIELDQFSPLEATEKYCRELFAVDRSASQPASQAHRTSKKYML